MSDPVSVACVMMQKNEDALLRPWIAHHGELFGYRNLHIFDNGSTSSSVLAELDEARARGVHVDMRFATACDYENKGFLLRDRILELERASEGHIDFFFPLDCDEFVGTTDGGALSFHRADVLRALRRHVGEKGMLKISHALVNCAGVTDRFVVRAESKCFCARGSLAELDHGSHHASSRFDVPDVTTKIIYVHLRHKPFDMVREAAREKLKLRVKSFDEETLRAYTDGQGRHLPKYLLMSEQEYAQTNRKGSFACAAFEARLKALSLPPPFRSMEPEPNPAR